MGLWQQTALSLGRWLVPLSGELVCDNQMEIKSPLPWPALPTVNQHPSMLKSREDPLGIRLEASNN